MGKKLVAVISIVGLSVIIAGLIHFASLDYAVGSEEAVKFCESNGLKFAEYYVFRDFAECIRLEDGKAMERIRVVRRKGEWFFANIEVEIFPEEGEGNEDLQHRGFD